MYLCDLPPRAYKLLLEFLACDRTFCNNIIPVFRTAPREDGLRFLSSVGLYLSDASSQQTRGQRARDAALAKGFGFGRRRSGGASSLVFQAEQDSRERDPRGLDQRLLGQLGSSENARRDRPVQQRHCQELGCFGTLLALVGGAPSVLLPDVLPFQQRLCELCVRS